MFNTKALTDLDSNFKFGSNNTPSIAPIDSSTILNPSNGDLPFVSKLDFSLPKLNLKTDNIIADPTGNNSAMNKLAAKANAAIKKREAEKMALAEYTKMNSNAVQDLYKKSKFRSNAYENGHDFRNHRHAEFLEQNPYAVRLKSFVAANTVVAFRVSPEITESRSVAYKSMDPLHMPGSIQVFQNSSPRTWQVDNIKLISRNAIEAEENLAIVNQLRAWQVSFFGSSKTLGREDYKYEMFGAPPEVLEFSAYSNATTESKGGLTNIRKVPVVIPSVTIPYPTDVDYIETATTKVPFPTVMTISMTLLETHSPNDYERFDLIAYKNGKLVGF